MNQVEQIPWSLRIKGGTTGAEGSADTVLPPCRQFLQTPIATMMLGAALMSGQPCLLWNTEVLLNEAIADSPARPQANGRSMLSALVKIIKSPEKEPYGYGLLFRLLVEPFALMNQSTAFYPVGGVPKSTNQHP